LDSNEVQFAVLRAARAAGVPAPPPMFYEPDPAVLGVSFLVTERLPGSTVIPWSAEGRAFLSEAGAGASGQQLLNILVAVHSVPPDQGDLARVFGLTPDSVAHAELHRLADAVRTYSTGPEPVLTDALGWLASHAPRCARPTLVHGDFRAGNLLFDGGRITGLLDWEFAHIGDPARDLAWLMARSNRVSQKLACDMIPLIEVLPRYQRAGGDEIDPAAIAFWDVFMLVESVAIWLRSTAAWKAGDLTDIRIARWTFMLPKLRLMLSEALERVDP
jgi:aminoglycoside phosphotransferase (APT) family kinase protein